MKPVNCTPKMATKTLPWNIWKRKKYHRHRHSIMFRSSKGMSSVKDLTGKAPLNHQIPRLRLLQDVAVVRQSLHGPATKFKLSWINFWGRIWSNVTPWRQDRQKPVLWWHWLSKFFYVSNCASFAFLILAAGGFQTCQVSAYRISWGKLEHPNIICF